MNTPKKPFVDPARVTVDFAGFSRRSLFIRLPQEFIAADLAEPQVWEKVQGNAAKALKRHDALYMVAYDESWVAEAIVADADGKRAVLAKPRITNLENDRFDGLFEDENYRVSWNGAGFVVIRKRDDHQMTQPAALASHAERDLRGLYPSGRAQ